MEHFMGSGYLHASIPSTPKVLTDNNFQTFNILQNLEIYKIYDSKQKLEKYLPKFSSNPRNT